MYFLTTKRAAVTIQRGYRDYKGIKNPPEPTPPPPTSPMLPHAMPVDPPEISGIDYDTYIKNRRPGSTTASEMSAVSKVSKMSRVSKLSKTSKVSKAASDAKVCMYVDLVKNGNNEKFIMIFCAFICFFCLSKNCTQNLQKSQ